MHLPLKFTQQVCVYNDVSDVASGATIFRQVILSIKGKNHNRPRIDYTVFSTSYLARRLLLSYMVIQNKDFYINL